MTKSFVYANIERCNRNYLRLSFIFLFIVLLILFMYSTTIYNFFFGPFPMDVKELSSLPKLIYKTDQSYDSQFYHLQETFPLNLNHYRKNNQYHYKIDFNNNNIDSTGIEYFVQYKITENLFQSYVGEERESIYLAVKINDKFQIIKATPYNVEKKVFSGIIRPIPLKLNTSLVTAKVGEEYIYQFLLPNLFDASDKFKREIFHEIVISGLLIILLILNFIRLIYRWKVIRSHPFFKRIHLYGKAGSVIESIDNELINIEPEKLNNKKIITPSWIIVRGIFSFKIMRNHGITG